MTRYTVLQLPKGLVLFLSLFFFGLSVGPDILLTAYLSVSLCHDSNTLCPAAQLIKNTDLLNTKQGQNAVAMIFQKGHTIINKTIDINHSVTSRRNRYVRNRNHMRGNCIHPAANVEHAGAGVGAGVIIGTY